MASQAKYEVYIPYPSVVSSAAMAYAQTELPGAHVSVEQGRQVYTDQGQENYSVLHITAEDEPFSDSTVKQVASYVADTLHVSSVLVSKSGGKSGIAVWNVNGTENWPDTDPTSTKRNTFI